MTRKIVSMGMFLFLVYRAGFSQSIADKKLVFEDNGSGDWTDQWFLDGTRARVENLPVGMYFAAGPDHGNDSSHAVLWTRQSFHGDLLIEYDYTRVDTATRCVNILYFLATGKGGEEYPKDISAWNEKREVPAMSTYFRNMNTYHISYAAFKANEYSGDHDYIRLRRYNPSKEGLKGSDILPDTFETGLFKPFHTYHITVTCLQDTITMNIQNKHDPADQMTCSWDISDVPDCQEGRIGLRHMYTRSAIYKDFKVWAIR